MNQLVTVTIPTLNAARTLDAALRSIFAARRPDIDVEVILVDGGSTDATIEIARSFESVRVETYGGKLLGARCIGIEKARGSFILLMDADHRVTADLFERGIAALEGHGSLVLGEISNAPDTLLGRMIAYDRELVHDLGPIQLHPVYGCMLPRFFRAELLKDAISAFTDEMRAQVWAHDHAMLYYEVYERDPRVAVLPLAIEHTEMAHFSELFRKFFRYGRQARRYTHFERYQEIFFKKNRVRAGSAKHVARVQTIASFGLAACKFAAYTAGYALAGKSQRGPAK